MDAIVEIIKSVGFPITVVVYLLYERSTVTKELVRSIDGLKIAVIKLEGRLS